MYHYVKLAGERKLCRYVINMYVYMCTCIHVCVCVVLFILKKKHKPEHMRKSLAQHRQREQGKETE